MASLHLAVVLASVRPGRKGPVVAEWFLRAVAQHGLFDATLLDLAEFDLPSDLTKTDSSSEFASAIGISDAVVVVTPEYNHGYPGALKNALDSVKYEWRGKPIGFVSYGGMSGGGRATEQLRQVVAELHMVSVRDSVAFPSVRSAFDANGNTEYGPAVDAADRMLSQLSWWAAAVNRQAAHTPYPGQ